MSIPSVCSLCPLFIPSIRKPLNQQIMHQNILKTRPGQLFKGHSMEASYNNNRDIVIRQSYYDVSIVDKLSTKDEPFTKAIYNQCITPKYVSKAIEVMYQKLHNKSIEFQIKLYNYSKFKNNIFIIQE